MKTNDGDLIKPLKMTGGDSLPNVATESHIINPFTTNYDNDTTHALMDNIAQQFIQSNGMVGYFLPKSFSEIDHVMGEELGIKYDKMWQFAFYLEDYTGFSSDGMGFDYGGFHSHDRMKVMINPKLFQTQCHGHMPEIGDWVYIPIDKSLFTVKFVDPYNKFYQAGYSAQYFMILNKTVYNQEEIDPILQNGEFIQDIYGETDLQPLFNLDGRLDTHIDEFTVSNSVQERAKGIIVDDSSYQGEGAKFDANRVEITSSDEIQRLLSGKR